MQKTYYNAWNIGGTEEQSLVNLSLVNSQWPDILDEDPELKGCY